LNALVEICKCQAELLKRGEPTSAAALPHPRTARCPQRRRSASSASPTHSQTLDVLLRRDGCMARPRLISERIVYLLNERDHHDHEMEIDGRLAIHLPCMPTQCVPRPCHVLRLTPQSYADERLCVCREHLEVVNPLGAFLPESPPTSPPPQPRVLGCRATAAAVAVTSATLVASILCSRSRRRAARWSPSTSRRAAALV
jgi:hypothetical protein